MRFHHQLLIALCLAVCAPGCSLLPRNRPGTLLAASLKTLQPLNDRDHYVYLWQRVVDGKREAEGIHVEHVTALEDGNYEIAISEDGVPSSRLHVNYDNETLTLVDEEDLAQGVRLTYSPPLTQLKAPVVVGEQSSSSKATIERIEDSASVNTVDVTQTVRVRSVPRVESSLGVYGESVTLLATRTLQTPAGAVEMKSAMVLVPGIGEIRSEGTSTSMLDITPGTELSRSVVTQRELACAIIDGKVLGDCRRIDEQLTKSRR